MTDQTRTGTYGSWYSYYLCDFSGEIMLPAAWRRTCPGSSELSQRAAATIKLHSSDRRTRC